MKRKLRIFSNIAIICLSVCMFAFGVYAASTVSVTTSGTVVFEATGVYAKITGSISGTTETGLTYADLTTNADGTITGDTSSWTSKNVTFDSDNEIVLTITVQNLATEEGRNIYAALYDIDQPASLNTTMLLGSKDYLSSTVTEIAPEASKTFQVKLSPKDLNASFTVDYEYLLDLDAEKFNAEKIASKIKTGVNNSEYGSITYSLDDATKTQLTLTATPNSGYSFLGFVQGDSNSSSFISNSNNYIVDLRYYTARQFNAIFYSSTQRINIAESTGGHNYYDVYIGSGYASFWGGQLNSFNDIADEVVHDNNTYKVYIISGSMLAIGTTHDIFKPNKNVSIFSSTSNVSGIDRDTKVLLTNVNYFDVFNGEFYLGNNVYINNPLLIQCFTYEILYFSMVGYCPNLNINENIIEYLQYNEWFTANYTKAASPTTYDGATYYLYTYTPAS